MIADRHLEVRQRYFTVERADGRDTDVQLNFIA